MLSSPVLRVILFLAPLCPICQNMSYDLRQLEAEFENAPVEFLGVFPNASTRQDQIDVFRETYGLKMPFVTDDEGWAKQLDARWTPEVFVLDAQDSILYRGRINDRYFAPGRRRNKTRNRDLQNAISDVLRGEAVRVPRTDAVGCPIEGIKLNTAQD
ncbi:redoxin domain-containing protein [Flavobacteriales bacterium]|nr:redoxin domain-containing protein [Flavobacteriales bacterium]